MLVEVNGAKLYVDVENSGLIPDGARMSEKPTLLLLHGGPGFDHSGFKPAFSALSDVAQIVYYDHRGNGRSTGTDPATWNLTQWGDDVKGLCDALGIVKPIVCGLSFGGFVAQAYATRYPEHPGKLILLSTVAKIDFPTSSRRSHALAAPKSVPWPKAIGPILRPRGEPTTLPNACPSTINAMMHHRVRGWPGPS